MTDEQITAALGDLQRDRLDGEQSCYMDWYEAALLELRDTRAQLRKLAQHVEMSFPEEVRTYTAWRHLSAWLDAHADLLAEGQP